MGSGLQGDPDRDEPSGRVAEVAAARKLVAARLSRGRLQRKLVLVAGVALFMVAVAWLTVEVILNVNLQSGGVHTLARVDSLVQGRASDIVVSYPASPVYVGIPLWPIDRSYRVGSQVKVVYDRHDPSHAVLANALPAPGAINGLGWFLLIAGLLLIGIACYVAWLQSRSTRAITHEPVRMSVTSWPDRRSSIGLTFQRDDRPEVCLRWANPDRWYPMLAPRVAMVFGELSPGSFIAAVDVSYQAVAFGRLHRLKPNLVRPPSQTLLAHIETFEALLRRCGREQEADWLTATTAKIGGSESQWARDAIRRQLAGGKDSLLDLDLHPTTASGLTTAQADKIRWDLARQIKSALSR